MEFLIFGSYARLKARLADYKKVKLFTDASVPEWAKTKIINAIKEAGCNIVAVCLPASLNSEEKAAALNSSAEDYVVALGDALTSSIAKYYAYCHIKPLAVIPFGEIAEHTFSKYSYLKDVKFCFYVCESPQFVFIDEEFFTLEQVNSMYKILSYKNIVVFEKEFEQVIFKRSESRISNIVDLINSAEPTLLKVAKTYATIGLSINETGTNAMLGNEYVLQCLMALQNRSTINNLLVSTNLLFKFYDCMFRFPVLQIEPNLNLHLKRLKDCYYISYLQGNSMLAPLPSTMQLKNLRGALNAYYPYFKAKLETCKTKFVASQTNLNNNLALSALALAPSLCSNNNILRLARDLGYFEKLLSGKNLEKNV